MASGRFTSELETTTPYETNDEHLKKRIEFLPIVVGFGFAERNGLSLLSVFGFCVLGGIVHGYDIRTVFQRQE